MEHEAQVSICKKTPVKHHWNKLRQHRPERSPGNEEPIHECFAIDCIGHFDFGFAPWTPAYTLLVLQITLQSLFGSGSKTL